MKKILAIILACFFAVSFVACGGGEDESSATLGTSSTAGESKVEESSKVTVSEDESSEAATSEDPSEAVSEGETSDATSEGETSEGETSEGEGDEPVEVTFTNKYISWKVATGNGARTPDVVKADDATSLKLSKFNDVLVAGDVGAFTYDFGKTLKDFTDKPEEFAVIVAEYDHETFSYVRESFAAVGEADESTKIPKDGFVIAIHKSYEDKINAISTTTNPLFPHGFAANRGLDSKIDAAKTAPTIDGKVENKEYGDVLWDIKPDNTLVSYAQFEKNNYTSTAKVYATYDAEYLYLAVVVDTPIHDNTATSTNAGDMWKYTCIQVNFSSAASYSSYISENWDWGINPTTTNDNRMRQYGFGVTNEGETLNCVWQGDSTKKCETCKVIRDGQVTTYEAAIAWSDLNDENGEAFAPKKGDKIGLSVSLNLGSLTSEFKNVTLRDGGGIIGINDWSKIPTITLD